MTLARTPYCTKIRYGITGAPILTEDDMDGTFAPGVGVRPTLIELVYIPARDGKAARIDASVTGDWMRFGKPDPFDGQTTTHFKSGPDGWPSWLAEEARLHDPAGPAPATDRAALVEIAAQAMREHYLVTNREEADADGNMPCRCGDWREPGPMGSDEDDWDSHLADAVLAVLPASTDRAAVQDAAPVKQRADCTETEWAEQERARFERLYTRETVRADLAEQRADTAARDADIYQQRLERLSDGYTKQRKRAEKAEADANHNADLVADAVQRAEQAEAETERLRTDRAAVLREAAANAKEIGYAHASTEAERLLTVTIAEGLRRMADETPQQPETQAPYPAVTEWRTETQRREEHWSPWCGGRYELQEARADFAETVERNGGRHAWRLIRATTTYTVEAEQPVSAPAAVAQPDEEARDPEVVAYRSPQGRSLYCLQHVGELFGLSFTPVTSEDLPDGGICTYPDCDADVLITQQPSKEAEPRQSCACGQDGCEYCDEEGDAL